MESCIRMLVNVCRKLCMIPFLTGLTACSPIVKKSSVAVESSLSPAIIYVSGCNEGPKGILGIFGSSDRALGEGICRALHGELSKRASTAKGAYRILPVTKKEGAKKFYDVIPDEVAEKSFHAKYRVILGPPYSLRQYYSVAGGYIQSVQAQMEVQIVDISEEKVVGNISLHPRSGGVAGAFELSNSLLTGLDGPRCEALDGWSVRGVFANAAASAKCPSFALPARE